MVQKAHKEGHLIGSHGYSHTSINALNEEELKDELMRTSSLIYALIGERPKYFRPPYGEYSLDSLLILESMGYSMVLWNMDSQDWLLTVDKSLELMQQTIQNSSFSSLISLQHDTYAAASLVVRQIYKDVIGRGYKIVRLDKCL